MEKMDKETQLKRKEPLIIAGPCSAETPEQIWETAQRLSKIPQVKIFRAGIWKPRTRPNSFEGVGEIGLPWLKRVKDELGLFISTEVAKAEHIDLAMKYDVDFIWVGARTTVSPFAVQELADALRGRDIPVMVKNPLNSDLSLWLGALERFEQAGLKKIFAIHRGFSGYEGQSKFRNYPLWKIPLELKKRMPHIPLICDPSHISGSRKYLFEICQKALDLDFEGLMVETHRDPKEAWSDAGQQITPETLKDYLEKFDYKNEYCENNKFEMELDNLRKMIDRIDKELIDHLDMRMKVVSKITEAKIKNNVTAFQKGRFDSMLKERADWGEDKGLPNEFINDIFSDIHAESIRRQTHRMSEESQSAQ